MILVANISERKKIGNIHFEPPENLRLLKSEFFRREKCGIDRAYLSPVIMYVFVFHRLKSLRISAVNNVSNHAKIVQGPRLVREFGGSETK